MPKVTVRVDDARVRVVSARLVVIRATDRGVAARVGLGRIATRRKVAVRWPRTTALRAGRYVVRAYATRPGAGHADSPGEATLVVQASHGEPEASPTPDPAGADGVFPVKGPVTYGDGFGAPRTGYSHQGQDLGAAQGTQVVAPRAGTVTSTAYQPSAAGEYVVMEADNGHSYFFAHCQRHSTAVTAGQAVTAGAPICLVGSTGRSSGPHLHFEIWVDGWRTSSKSHPIDPRPQLRIWAD